MYFVFTVILSAARRVATSLGREADTVIFFVGLAALSYGAWLFQHAAGFITGGVLLVWWTLPTRPPFIERPARRAKDAA